MTSIYILTGDDFKNGRAQPLYFTIDGAAAAAGLYREAIAKAVNLGALPFVTFGSKRRLIRRDDLVTWIETRSS
jgi:excisionase family DNA binding protein